MVNAPLETCRERRNWLIHLLYVRSDFAQCLNIIEEQLVEAEGLNEYALYVKGLIRRSQGKLQESLALFEAAMMISPRSVRYFKQVGRSLALLGKHRAALVSYNEALEINSEEWELLKLVARSMLALKRYAEAEEYLRRSLGSMRHETTYQLLAKCFIQQDRLDRAVETYLEALELSPENAEFLSAIGALHLRMGNQRQALDYLGNSLNLNPNNTKALLAAGSILHDHQEYDVALGKYRMVVAQKPSVGQLWNNIAMALYGKGHVLGAISCLKRAANLCPFEWVIVYNLGIVFLKTQQYASAFQHFSAAINLKTSYAPSYTFLGMTLSGVHDTPNAYAAFDKALEITKDHMFHLQYALVAYHAHDLDKAVHQLDAFDKLWASLSSEDRVSDSDLVAVRDKLHAALQKSLAGHVANAQAGLDAEDTVQTALV